MKKTLYILVVMFMVAQVILSACAPKPAVSTIDKFKAFTYQQALAFKQYYETVYPQETKYSAMFAEVWMYADNKVGGIKDMKFLAENCYSNVEEILKEATIGIYDKTSTTESDVLIDDESLVSALVVNDLYPANAETCSQMLRDTLPEVVKARQGIFEMLREATEIRRTLSNLYDGTVETAVARRLLNLYGQEFIEYANGLLVKGGVEPFPADFIGFPTSGLSAQTASRQWYQHYLDVYNGVKPVSDARYSKEMYFVIWAGPESVGQATLYRQAAWEFMGRSFVNSATQNAVDCGQGVSLTGSLDENCNEVQP